MIAVIINGIAAIFGALLGVVVQKGISEKLTRALYSAMALCVIAMGINGAIKSENFILMLFSMAVGTLMGTAVGIENGMNHIGDYVKNCFHAGAHENFQKGFVTLSIMGITGSMAILGPIQAALMGDSSLLYFKSLLDFTGAFVFGSLYGIGAIPAGIAIAVYELIIYFFANVISPLMTADAIRELNAVGSLMIIAIGLNMLEIVKLKVADYLPALFIPIVYYYIISLC